MPRPSDHLPPEQLAYDPDTLACECDTCDCEYATGYPNSNIDTIVVAGEWL